MKPKRLEVRFSRWLIKLLTPRLSVVAPWLLTNYSLQDDVLTFKRPFRKLDSWRIDELDEIGVETTDQGPFAEDMFWILKRGEVHLRIGDPHLVFKMLMDRFGLLKGFNWVVFAEAQSCTQNRYFVCWKRHG